MRSSLLAALLFACLSGCVSTRTVLVNDGGEHVTCTATAMGILGSIDAQIQHDNCVTEAKQKGYRVEAQYQ